MRLFRQVQYGGSRLRSKRPVGNMDLVVPRILPILIFNMVDKLVELPWWLNDTDAVENALRDDSVISFKTRYRLWALNFSLPGIFLTLWLPECYELLRQNFSLKCQTDKWSEWRKSSIRGSLIHLKPNSSNKHHKNCMVDSKENY